MVQAGHRVTVLAPSYQGLGDHEIDGVAVKRFRYAPAGIERLTHEQGAPNRIRNPLYQALAVPYVLNGCRVGRKLGREQNFDVVHVHWPFPHGPIGRAVAKASNAPLLMTAHGAEFALARRKKWVAPLLRKALRQADHLVANSNDTASKIKELSGCDATVVPFGTTVFPKHSPTPANPRPRVAFTGRLIERKGVEYLLRAIPRILSKCDTDFFITGSGDQREKLEALAANLGITERVRFLGFVSNEKLNEVYARCDVWVNPSIIDSRGDTEGLGVGAIEAYAHRKPVVASAVGGIPDAVRHGETGWLVPQKDERTLANAILNLLQNPARAEQFGEAGLEFAQREFNWTRLTRKLEAIYFDSMTEFGQKYQEVATPSPAPQLAHAIG